MQKHLVVNNENDHNITHILKTDDDSYVHLDRVEEYLTAAAATATTIATNNHQSSADQYMDPFSHFDYIGQCMDYQARSPGGDGNSESLEKIYPNYASGAGYFVSLRFATCLANVAPNFHYAVTAEDATTGLLARECQIPCTTPTGGERIVAWAEPDPEARLDDASVLIQHYIDPPTMFLLHDKNCSLSASFDDNGNSTIDTTGRLHTNNRCSPGNNTNVVFGGTIPIRKHGKVGYRMLLPNSRDIHHPPADNDTNDNDDGGGSAASVGGVIVAVLSTPGKEGRNRRNEIRSSWSKNHSNVYFIVATSDWNYVKHEFYLHKDIFWIRHELDDEQKDNHNHHHHHRDKNKRRLLEVGDKMSVFVAAMHKHLSNNSTNANTTTEFLHILKVTDDYDVSLDDVKNASANEYRDKDIIGNCMSSARHLDNATPSSSVVPKVLDTASGYLISLRLAGCLANNSAAIMLPPSRTSSSINDDESRFIGTRDNVSSSSSWCRHGQFECFAW
jgi:hypothetical protein